MVAVIVHVTVLLAVSTAPVFCKLQVAFPVCVRAAFELDNATLAAPVAAWFTDWLGSPASAQAETAETKSRVRNMRGLYARQLPAPED